MALDLSDYPRRYATPTHRPQVLQLCPLTDDARDKLDAIALALGSDGKIYGVNETGALFLLGRLL